MAVTDKELSIREPAGIAGTNIIYKPILAMMDQECFASIARCEEIGVALLQMILLCGRLDIQTVWPKVAAKHIEQNKQKEDDQKQ